MINNIGKYFYTSIIGFCFGIAFTEVYEIQYSSLLFVMVVTFGVTAFLFVHKKIKNKLDNTILFCVVFFLAFVFGGFRVDQVLKYSVVSPLNVYEGQTVTLVGKVIGEQNSRLTVNVFAVVRDNKPEYIDEETILYNNAVGMFDYNDTVVIKGKIDRPQNFDTNDVRDFDYVAYLKRQGVYHVMSFGSIIEQRQGESMTLRGILYGIKNWFISNVESLVGEPESSLANGVTVAGKGSLPKDVQMDFVRAGLIHIVVLSGYNIAIVIRAMMYIFGIWGRRIGIVFGGAGIILFVIMTGGTAPVIRSAIMAGITLLGALSYKNVLQNRALFGAVFVMILANPLSLLDDASLALSVLATFAIINCAEPVKKGLAFVTERLQIRQILAETLATQVIVLPYLLYEIGNLSIIAPISNIIVLPLIPWIMMLTFIVGMISWIPVISLPFAGLLIILTTFVIQASHVMANIPFGYFEIQHFPLWVMVLCYGTYFLFWHMFEFKKSKRIGAVSNTTEPY